ncbi:MAG: TetR/AcrR family transcriptional regulator [Anaerolineaceae bacterium]|nr:TetR/AcrR family transcriptional regulator [Anaerolineaceae bacterium]
MIEGNSTSGAEAAIIEATIDCIEEFGLNGATNRRIAAKAGVNIAAINYYFRSKQVLLDTVMQITLDNAFDWEDLRALPGEDALSWCTEIFVDLLKGAKRYPGLTRAHFQDVFIEANYQTPGAKRMQAFSAQLVDELLARGLDKDRGTTAEAVTQLCLTFISASMIPQFYAETFNIDLTDEAQIRAFFRNLVRKLLG